MPLSTSSTQVELHIMPELPVRLGALGLRDMSKAATIADLARTVLNGDLRDAALVFLADRERRLIAYTEVCEGSRSPLLVTTREMYRASIVAGASSIVMCHSHLNGHLAPRAHEIELSRAARAAGDLLGVSIVDHIIVAPNSDEYYSLRQMGVLP